MLVPQSYEPRLLLLDYNFLRADDTRSDPAEITDTVHCYKFVSRTIPSRILISYDPTENNP